MRSAVVRSVKRLGRPVKQLAAFVFTSKSNTIRVKDLRVYASPH